MIAGVLEQVGRGARHAREVRRGVEHRVPLATLERLEAGLDLGVAVAEDVLELREEVGAGPAAVKEIDAVPVLQRCTHDGRAEETGAAENQQLQGFLRLELPGRGP